MTDGNSDGEDQTATSERLSSSAHPKNRLFPKTRSWFTLGAPLELLSPLAVLRVSFALASACWLAIGLLGGTRITTSGVITVSATTFAVWCGLLRIRTLDLHIGRLLVAYWTAVVGVLMWCSHGSLTAGVYGAWLLPIAIFTALFLGRRAVMIQTAGSAIAVGAALVSTVGVGRAIYLTLFASAALLMAPLAVLLLIRSIRRQGSIDPDTGLPNGFGLAQQLAITNETNFIVAVVVLEGVGFAREALGYRVGTEVLRRAVEDLGQVLPPGAAIGRVEGDELIVTVRGEGGAWAASDAESREGERSDEGDRLGAVPDMVGKECVALADTLGRAISAGRYLVGTIDVPLVAHVGIAVAPWNGSNVAELVRRASLSARHAQSSGLPVSLSDGDTGALTIEDLEMLGNLRLAPERGELSLAYQPQVVGAVGSVRAVEALLRWESPRHGRVAPGHFIPLAERVGAVAGLTKWVVGEALDAQVRWRLAGIELPVSVNISAKCLPVAGFATWVLTELSSRGLPASCLTIEVTETAVSDPMQAVSTLSPLHHGGVRISIDDFGTGFTSLAQLPDLPLDELKIDQRFVLRSVTSSADDAIVRTIGELAHRLGLRVVAEGVETEAIADRMIAMGIDLLQGYYFAVPMKEQALLMHLAKVDGPPVEAGTPRQLPEVGVGNQTEFAVAPGMMELHLIAHTEPS